LKQVVFYPHLRILAQVGRENISNNQTKNKNGSATAAV